MDNFKRLVLLAVVLLSAGCSVFGEQILSRDSTGHFAVEQMSCENDTVLKVSGLSFNSAMSVHRISTENLGDKMLMKVFIKLHEEGASGSFEQLLLVPDSVNKVVYGEDMSVIWSR